MQNLGGFSRLVVLFRLLLFNVRFVNFLKILLYFLIFWLLFYLGYSSICLQWLLLLQLAIFCCDKAEEFFISFY
jgi:hypothetical protein